MNPEVSSQDVIRGSEEEGSTIRPAYAATTLSALNRLFWHLCWKTLLVLLTAFSSTLVVVKCSVTADIYIFGQVLKNWAEFCRHVWASLCFAKAVILLKILNLLDRALGYLSLSFCEGEGGFEIDFDDLARSMGYPK